MSNENQELVNQMHNALRECEANAYRYVTGTEQHVYKMRLMLHKAHKVGAEQKTAISFNKGFPYVSYGQLPKRTVTRFGRWYRSCVDPDAPDHEVGEMVALVHAQALKAGYVFDTELAVEVLRGEAIYHAYRDMVGASSCMAGPANAFRTWFYVFNPEVVGLAVLNNKKARALIWNTEQGHTVLDRIYPNSGPHSTFLMNWALEQGYLVRTNNAASHSEAFRDKNDKRYSPMTVRFNKYHPRRLMPYLDTFAFLESCVDNRRLAITSNTPTKHDWIMVDHNNTAQPYEYVGEHYGVLPDWETNMRAPKKPASEDLDGAVLGVESELCQCENCGVEGHEDEFTFVDNDAFCEECYDRLFACCEICEERCYVDDLCMIDDLNICDNCYEESTTECHDCGAVHLTNHMYPVGGEWICHTCKPKHTCRACDTMQLTLKDGLCDVCSKA